MYTTEYRLRNGAGWVADLGPTTQPSGFWVLNLGPITQSENPAGTQRVPNGVSLARNIPYIAQFFIIFCSSYLYKLLDY